MLSMLDGLAGAFMSALKQPIESFIRLETSDDDVTLVAEDGSLLTFLRVDGSRQIIGDTEYQRIIEQATIKLGARFDRPGFALQVYFMRNPARIVPELKTMMRPNRSAAQSIGLELDDLFEERAKHLPKYLSWEDIYFVCWTRPSALSTSDQNRSKKLRKERKWINSANAQYPFTALEPLRARHRSFVSSMTGSLDELGIRCEVVEVHDALKAVRASIYPTRSQEDWRACLPGDRITPRAPRSNKDASDILWPQLRRQICTWDAENINHETVRIADSIWSGVDMTLGPMDPSPFPQLLSRLIEEGVPFRISFLIESGGMQGAQLNKFIASVLGFTNDINKQIKESIDGLAELSRNEPVVKMRVSLATWAAPNQFKLLEERVSNLIQSLESWGYCQAALQSSDPLEAVMSSALGIACASTAPPGIVPLYEVMKLLPWQRASSPFDSGAILLRTPDGRVWPYQTGSSLTTTWFDLIFAQPGAGKSVLMNALTLGTCLTAGLSSLPYAAIIDIGPSSSGLISLIRDALPPGRRHEATHYKLSMTSDFAVNPFDTQLGCRAPLPDERAYLVELLTLLCTPPGQESAYDGIAQLAGLVVDEMYRWRDDNGANAEPRPYLPHVDAEVDKAIAEHRIKLMEEPYWWDVVDALFDKGLVHEAALAQRHATPTLTDAVTAARRQQIRDLLEETRVSGGSEGVINAFERMITSAIREFPILAGVTQFDISTSRICALDLQDVCPQGDDTADRQTAIMYMLARHTLVRSWWLGEDALKYIPERFRGYHESRLQDIRETPKRLCYDEFHRTSKSKSVRSQIVRDVREGRKWGVQIVLSSQLLDDFDKDMVDLATGVWILGSAVSDNAVNDAVQRFGLSETARWIMRHRLTGPKSTGAPALLVLGTNEGRYEQFLINTLGAVELWALSTSSEDVAIRRRLYARLGAQAARRVLAAAYPGGSARSEIRRRVALKVEKGEIESGAQSKVIDEIVAELIELATGVQISLAEEFAAEREAAASATPKIDLGKAAGIDLSKDGDGGADSGESDPVSLEKQGL